MANFGQSFARGVSQNFLTGVGLGRQAKQDAIQDVERAQQREDKERELVGNILDSALKLPADQRAGFFRMATKAMGIKVPSGIEEQFESLAFNEPFLKSVKKLPDVIRGASRERQAGQLSTEELEKRTFEQVRGRAPTPGGAPTAPGLGAPGGRPGGGLLTPTQPGAAPPILPQIVQPTPEAEVLATQAEGAARRGEALPKGFAEDVRKATQGPEIKPPTSEVGLFFVASQPDAQCGPECQQARRTIQRRTAADPAFLANNRIQVAAQMTSDNPQLRDRAIRTWGFITGQTVNQVTAMRIRAFDRMKEQIEAERSIAGTGPLANLPANHPKVKLREKEIFKRVMEEFFQATVQQRPFAAKTNQELFNMAKTGDERAVQELKQRGAFD